MQERARLPVSGHPPLGFQDKGGLASTARNPATTSNSKWSINIQEIVKRTQRNLDRGSSSLTRVYNNEERSTGALPQKLEPSAQQNST